MTEERTRLPATDPDEVSATMREPSVARESTSPREPLKVSFSIPQIVGGALAAATAAALGSTLGVAGTVIGASVASVVGGVAGTLYSAGIDRTHRTVTAAIKRSYDRVKVVEPSDEESVATAEGMPEAPDADQVEVTVEPVESPWAGRRQLWLRMGVSALAIFVISAVVVTVIELAWGRSFDGRMGTTVGQVTRPQPQPTVTVTAAPTSAPTPEPSATSSAPTTKPTPSPTPSLTPTPQPTPVPTTSPVPQATQS